MRYTGYRDRTIRPRTIRPNWPPEDTLGFFAVRQFAVRTVRRIK